MVLRTRTLQAKTNIPEPRHDNRQLENAVLSIKASFSALDNKCAKLEKEVAHSRTRLFAHILNKHAISSTPAEGTTGNSRARPSQNFARAAVRRVPLVRRPRDDGSDSVSDEELDGDSRSNASEAESAAPSSASEAAADALAVLNIGAFRSSHGEAASPTGSQAIGKQVRMRHLFHDGPSLHSTVDDEQKRPAASNQRSGERLTLSMPSSGPKGDIVEGVTNAQSEAPVNNLTTKGGATISTPRVQVRVAADRPFSAPRMRWSTNCATSIAAARPSTAERPVSEAAAASAPQEPPETHQRRGQRQGADAQPIRRSTAMSGRPGTVAMPVVMAGGSACRTPRPRSAFGNLQRRQPRPALPRERPPVVQFCEPQARLMDQLSRNAGGRNGGTAGNALTGSGGGGGGNLGVASSAAARRC
mmetsp:Transcript_52768/g.112944  ORF Transcript_52768/g.112944 Transcript_52768/m.112944 type:complete len:417 (+) Transcript_52768:66-1316(+)